MKARSPFERSPSIERSHLAGNASSTAAGAAPLPPPGPNTSAAPPSSCALRPSSTVQRSSNAAAVTVARCRIPSCLNGCDDGVRCSSSAGCVVECWDEQAEALQKRLNHQSTSRRRLEFEAKEGARVALVRLPNAQDQNVEVLRWLEILFAYLELSGADLFHAIGTEAHKI